MARITVDDCLPNVENLFQLVLLASQRARRLANPPRAPILVPPTRTAHATRPDVTTAPVSSRVTLALTTKALPARGRAGAPAARDAESRGGGGGGSPTRS